MSKTYREVIISNCGKCNKPKHLGFGYTVEFGDEVCECASEHTSYWDWGGVNYSPRKIWDNSKYYSVGDWQKHWNRKQRSEVKQKLHEYTKAYPEEDFKETFPISKNQALWDAH